MTGSRDTVAAYWAAADARDWAAFGALLATDVWPEPYDPPPGREHLVERY